MQQYSGFGGLKCILNPAQSEMDRAYWKKSEIDLFPMVTDLHKLIRENSKDENEYKRYFGSLKSSISEHLPTLSNRRFLSFSTLILMKKALKKFCKKSILRKMGTFLRDTM